MTKKQASKRKAHPCWWCGAECIWQSDFTREDCCMEGEGIVSFLRCSGCDAEIQYTSPPDEEKD